MTALALLAALASFARADVVELKNGNRMEGVVASDDGERITLDFGYGSTIIDKSEIERIRRSDKKTGDAAATRIKRRKYEAGLAVPEGAERLDSLYHKAQSLREQALDARRQQNDLDEEAAAIVAELPELKAQYGQYTAQFQGVDAARDPYRYNSAVGRINQTDAKLHADALRLQEIERLKGEADGKVHSYLDAYRALDDEARGPGASFLKGAGDYAPWLSGELAVMARDFRRETARVEKNGESLFVDVLINGKVPARLLVDTGASSVLLYKEVTDRLALPADVVVGKSRAVVADGRAIEGQLVRLDSVAVGKTRASGVIASLVPVTNQGFDGLLGMTFLGKFITRVDAVNGRLILEDLKAP